MPKGSLPCMFTSYQQYGFLASFTSLEVSDCYKRQRQFGVVIRVWNVLIPVPIPHCCPNMLAVRHGTLSAVRLYLARFAVNDDAALNDSKIWLVLWYACIDNEPDKVFK